MLRPLARLIVVIILAATVQLSAAQKLIGTKAPSWEVDEWFNSPPLKLEDLRGQVVLVRWWTAPECPYCAATAPALNEFYEKYRERGLAAVGLYHHKSDEPLRVAEVKKFAAGFGFKFPVGIDRDWKTLHRWWLDSGHRQWTSVTFLIDRDGVIQHIHPGGQYIKGDADYNLLQRKIEELLNEPRQQGGHQ
jgi:peroxiredoxin